jgi:hypothetical protein
MGRPNGIILNRWFYWPSQDGAGFAFAFSEDGNLLGWDMLFGIGESRLEEYDPARAWPEKR